MRTLPIFALLCAALGGCATTSAPGPAAPAGWKYSYSRDYDTRNSNQIASAKARVPLEDTVLEGVWNDVGEATIVLIHREGDELRLVVAVGDTRPNIPLTMFEVSNMGNRVSTPEERTRATQALTAWRSGPPTEKNVLLWSLAGKNVSPEIAQGAWADGNAGCETSRYWGNFTLSLHKDKSGAPVVALSVMASKQKFGGGIGGQDFEYSRIMYLEKSAKPIPPSLLEAMKKPEHFCRKTAEN